MNLKVRKSSILLFVLIFLADHCFWLVNANQQSRINEICWGVILVAFFLIVLRSEYNNILNKNEYQFVAFLISAAGRPGQWRSGRR